MLWMRNKENSFPIHTLIWSPALVIMARIRNVLVRIANREDPDQTASSEDPDQTASSEAV